jgi:hypothetical protein
MKRSLLRAVLLLDAAVLFLLGALLIIVPRQAGVAFQFTDLPPIVNYIISLWGCALASLGLGYAAAARDPVRHVAWIQVGIARGALECIVGAAYVSRGVVTFQQGWFGIAVAAFIMLAYVVL